MLPMQNVRLIQYNVMYKGCVLFLLPRQRKTVASFSPNIFPQTVLALRGSNGVAKRSAYWLCPSMLTAGPHHHTHEITIQSRSRSSRAGETVGFSFSSILNTEIQHFPDLSDCRRDHPWAPRAPASSQMPLIRGDPPKWFLAITCAIWLCLIFRGRGSAWFFGAHLLFFQAW